MEWATRLQDVIERAPGVKSFRFPRPDEFQYDPGQWMFITIGKGGEMTKHFTISSSPTEGEFIEFTKKITDHEFSLALDRMRAGDPVTIDGPYGEFTFKGEYPGIGMLTGGIGITPFRSMIRYCTDKQIPSRITLLYGNHNEESIVFRRELEEMGSRNPNLAIRHCLSHPGEDWAGRRGHVDRAVIEEEIPDYLERVFYVCGPPALVTGLVGALGTLQVPPSQVKVEDFPGY
ncbi:MAG TPA: FAD-dependent oxidoreductase [Methanomicrobiales archaeon]|nr:FAD-dependent oxidoreductase [Methanomicrobiales archaeon]